MFKRQKNHSNENWLVTIRRKRGCVYFNKLVYGAWKSPKKLKPDYDSKSKEIIFTADNNGIDIHPSESGYEISIAQFLRDNQINTTRALQYRPYLRGNKLFIKLTEPVRDVTIYKEKRKAPAKNSSNAMTERERWQEFLDM